MNVYDIDRIAFNGLYVTQEVYSNGIETEMYLKSCEYCSANGHLILKDIMNITDEDSEELGINVHYENFVNEPLDYYTVDMLRAKGYAMPFRGYLVSKMVELGWIVLEVKQVSV